MHIYIYIYIYTYISAPILLLKLVQLGALRLLLAEGADVAELLLEGLGAHFFVLCAYCSLVLWFICRLALLCSLLLFLSVYCCCDYSRNHSIAICM